MQLFFENTPGGACCIMWNWFFPQFPADLVTFTGEILNGNFIFFVQCFCCIIQKSIQRKLLKNIVILTRRVMLLMDTYIAIVKKHNICLVFIGNTFFCLTQHLSDFAITDPLFNFTHLFAEGDCKGGIFELYDRYDQYFCK